MRSPKTVVLAVHSTAQTSRGALTGELPVRIQPGTSDLGRVDRHPAHHLRAPWPHRPCETWSCSRLDGRALISAGRDGAGRGTFAVREEIAALQKAEEIEDVAFTRDGLKLVAEGSGGTCIIALRSVPRHHGCFLCRVRRTVPWSSRSTPGQKLHFYGDTTAADSRIIDSKNGQMVSAMRCAPAAFG